MVQWDGMDSEDQAVVCGTIWDIPWIPMVHHGTVGWDEQWGSIGTSHGLLWCAMIQWDGMAVRIKR